MAGLLVQPPTPNLEDQVSVFMTPGDRVAQLYPQALGTHFSRLLRHEWVTVGLFFNPGHHTGSQFDHAQLIQLPRVYVHLMRHCAIHACRVMTADHVAKRLALLLDGHMRHCAIASGRCNAPAKRRCVKPFFLYHDSKLHPAVLLYTERVLRAPVSLHSTGIATLQRPDFIQLLNLVLHVDHVDGVRLCL
jgi:hypothetical protein